MKSNYTRRAAGYQAKKIGDTFEYILRRAAVISGFNVIQIHMGARMVSATKVLRMANAFDFVFTKLETEGNIHRRYVIFCDAKSIKDKTYASSHITAHQCKELLVLHEQKFSAGYIICFRTLNNTVFFSAAQLEACRITPRSSLKPQDGISLGDNQNINLMKIFEGPRR